MKGTTWKQIKDRIEEETGIKDDTVIDEIYVHIYSGEHISVEFDESEKFLHVES